MPARLAVCERFGEWAVALRRELPGDEIRVYETRTLNECWQLLARCPSSFVVTELTSSGVDALVDGLVRLERLFPLARMAVVAERSLAAYEPLVREAGAVYFVAAMRECGPLARLACCHLQQAASPRRSITEAIWQSLPWATVNAGT